MLQRYIRDVCTPYLVAMSDRQITQQVGVDVARFAAFA